MMNGPMWSLGLESGLKSGTSLPAHLPVPSLNQTCLRLGSQGLPVRSHDARLYMTRRFMGHDQAHWGWMPKPEGSAGSRRCVLEPASGQEPQYSQLPDEVVPSSFSQAKPGSCWPAFQSDGVCFSSCRSARALPLISLATSVSDGLYGVVYAHARFRIGSGNLVSGLSFSCWYSSRTFKKMVARMA